MLRFRSLPQFRRGSVRSLSRNHAHAAPKSGGIAIYADKAIVVLNKPFGVDSQLSKSVSVPGDTVLLARLICFDIQGSRMRDILKGKTRQQFTSSCRGAI